MFDERVTELDEGDPDALVRLLEAAGGTVRRVIVRVIEPGEEQSADEWREPPG